MSHTIYDIARRAGVSIATVSRVFNQSTKVSTKTRDKVLRIAEEVGYHPQGFAQGLASRKKRIIMAVVPVLSNYFFMQVLAGIQDAIAQTDFELHIYNIRSNEKRIHQIKRLVSRQWADGYLFISAHLHDKEWLALHQLGYNMVLIDDEHPACHYFQVNNFEGAQNATRYFLDKGYRRIAMITAGEASIPASKRQLGFKKAHQNRDLAVDETLMVTGETMYRDGFNEQNGYEAMKKLIRLSDPPEAVVCASDIQSIGALAAMKEYDRSFPIIGYDDIELSQYMGLSTMRQPMYDMGEKATRVLFRQIDDQQVELVQEEFIPRLIERSTTGLTKKSQKHI